ncbi:hypothetical protein A3I18_01000 [Candidatus Campbellbacteria bacterium RIFCSPLOWO2_02_FULL_35_11]|uniref:Uncharacterized protein n=2 Tax=Candidatus Campbelliibacteriota TaxID=1752727 RepID=A0A1F5EKE4_9BACT|nr:MAG: hypothetical protein A3E89_02240 [Candidatus Campbellbacteria bacterium RIFCSPHIGHO2_12_FULL_35_10]OGD69684.1 MAG: hypothetical protein A3I18_01000 [Candidatus Campbellbacteria bacterium RIFCSPLOWO2_02_FULL_35_11]
MFVLLVFYLCFKCFFVKFYLEITIKIHSGGVSMKKDIKRIVIAFFQGVFWWFLFLKEFRSIDYRDEYYRDYIRASLLKGALLPLIMAVLMYFVYPLNLWNCILIFLYFHLSVGLIEIIYFRLEWSGFRELPIK